MRKLATSLGALLSTAVVVLSPSPALAGEGAETEDLHRPGVRSHYAFVNERATARVSPSEDARAVARLKLRTEDDTDELVLVLARKTDAEGEGWLQVRLPVRPNGTTGWVPEEALGTPQVVRTWLQIDLRTLRATLVRSGRTVLRARIGVGKASSPTPRGEFYVRHRLTGYGQAGSFYGPVAFGTSARSDKLTDWPGGGIIGLHGTSLPQLIPGRVSHGCVRFRNRDILRLNRLMPVGTPLTIR